jgi:protocatechuate 3,4-dioxygenase beta subunit
MRTLHRRQFLGAGLGTLLVACTGRAAGSPRDALLPTPQVPDDDGDGPPPPIPAAGCEPTADNIEGPFYKAGAPNRATLAGDRERGERLVLAGRVASTGCAPLAGAVLDIWQADARGAYDNDGWGLRGQLTSDAQGRWQVKTIVPGRYLNGRRYRPMHIHVKLRARGYQELTTQLYFAGDEYIEGDPFVVPSLVMPTSRAKGVRKASFDFVLAPAT